MVTLKGDSGDNQLRGSRENDSLSGLGGDDSLFGFQGKDDLIGGRGNDYLDGGIGSDRLIGGAGNDTYIVNTTGDRTIEQANQGIDTVQASISWTLSTNLENLTLTGRANLNGTGNTLDNTVNGNRGANRLSGGDGNDTLIGGKGNDILDGGNGNDTLIGGLDVRQQGEDVLDTDVMTGGAGDDTYYVNQSTDTTVEGVGGGSDTVFVVTDRFDTTSYTLASNCENLEFLGKVAINGIGNDLDNTIQGNAANNNLEGKGGDDTLQGGAGIDTLTGDGGNDFLVGGDGDDQFIYVTDGAAFTTAAIGKDTLTDFDRSSDHIVLSRATFGLNSLAGSGFSLDSEFDSVSNDEDAAKSEAVIVFSRATNTLFYNANGSAAGFGNSLTSGAFIIIANVSNISTSDFVITV